MATDSVARSISLIASDGVKEVRQMVEALPKGLVYKGAVNTYDDLPSTGQEIGDTYTTLDTGAEYAWGKLNNVNQWIEVGVHYSAGANVQINNNVISATDTTYSDATTSASGLMSASDKTKLDGISNNAKNVSVSDTGTATDEIQYITVDGVEKKIAGGGSAPSNMVTTDTYQTITGNKVFESVTLADGSVFTSTYGNQLVKRNNSTVEIGNWFDNTNIYSSTTPTWTSSYGGTPKTIATTEYVSANPATTTETLTGITIGDTSYAVSGGGGSDLPSKPSADGQYMLNIASGVASWVSIPSANNVSF